MSACDQAYRELRGQAGSRFTETALATAYEEFRMRDIPRDPERYLDDRGMRPDYGKLRNFLRHRARSRTLDEDAGGTPEISIDGPLGDDPDGIALAEVLADPASDGFADALAEACELADQLVEIDRALPDRYRDGFRGLTGVYAEDYERKEVAVDLGISDGYLGKQMSECRRWVSERWPRERAAAVLTVDRIADEHRDARRWLNAIYQAELTRGQAAAVLGWPLHTVEAKAARYLDWLRSEERSPRGLL